MEKHVTYKESGLKTSPLKECVQVVVKPQLSPCVTTAANFCLKDDVKGVHNKENNQHDGVLDEVNLGCEAFEDSGFLSLQNSQIEDVDNIKELEQSPGQDIFSPCTPVADYHKAKHTASKLPILKFQHAVCQDLANSFKRTHSYDWSVISRLAEDSGLERVLGGNMGLECMAVLKALLERDMKHILTRILRLLGDVDLISCRKVSKTWRKIYQDKSALRRCDQAKQRLRAASLLKQHESLKPCKRCGSPANADAMRATCTRLSCAFDFCTLCQGPFHGSSACHTGLARGPSSSRAILIGSARSKRNVRRL
ncbi:F-box only protein 5-like isoform X2 [Coregonus clupeaformis]|uniref:F-box only protein 5-like isoform X2 n=1 Tax=Coregonus clupeaformis TaxID=59861 RepID=UPI001E1C66CF|nr:F-box only protein 5-like isoform X2 [Coregonus clupeaformis]